MEIKKKENEAVGSLIFRFNKKIQQSGTMKEYRKRRFRTRPVSRIKLKLSALYKNEKAQEVARLKKLGKLIK